MHPYPPLAFLFLSFLLCEEAEGPREPRAVRIEGEGEGRSWLSLLVTRMSEFKEILTSAQLIKHYELLHFLSHHPNERFTVAQLDSLLPHGVSLQRFPEEWYTLVGQGACWHRSVELHRDESYALAADGADFASTMAQRASYILCCVKPEIHTLEELSGRLESPSTLLDQEGCVALHTDEVLISPALLRQAQHCGLIYYFPDVYDKRDYRQYGPKLSGPALPGANRNDGTTGVTSLPSELVNEPREDLHSSGAHGGKSFFLALPPGISLQHKLLTSRGVAEMDHHCLPLQLRVGERVLILIDNSIAVRKLNQANRLDVSCEQAGIKLAAASASTVPQESRGVGFAGGPPPTPPLRIRREAVAVRLHHGSASPQPQLVATKLKMEWEAVLPGTLKLIMTVNGMESVMLMEVLEVETTLPGVMIRRDRQPESLMLPDAFQVADAIVSPPPSQSYPFEAVHRVGKGSGSLPSAPRPIAEPSATITWEELVPLPWWQNSSRFLLSVRDLTYPTSDATVKAATAAVFSAQSLAEEAALKKVKWQLQEGALRRDGAAGGKKRRRTRFRPNQVLSNRHLLHLGMDFSIPFSAAKR